MFFPFTKIIRDCVAVFSLSGKSGRFYPRRSFVSLRMEPLESRELLAATPGTADWNALATQQQTAPLGVIYVTTLIDSNNASDGLISLREALNYAEDGGQIIFQSAGTITLSQSLGQLQISSKNIEISAANVSSVTINAQGNSRILYISNSLSLDINVEMTNINFINGNSGATNGGALLNTTGCNIVLTNCSFSNNRSGTANGGALATSGKTTISNCQFTNNQAGQGGALSVEPGGKLILSASTFANNSATTRGGALYVNQNYSSSNDVTATNCVFRNNQATTSGGAISINAGVVQITNSQVMNNSSTSFGGGIYLINSKLDITNSIIRDNSTNYGGGIYAAAQTVLNLFESTITNNIAIWEAGGIYHVGAQTQIYSSTISNNRSNQETGGIYNSSVMYIANSHIQNNIAGHTGGGLTNQGSLTLVNSTVTGNTAVASAGGIDNSGNSSTNKATLILNKTMISGNAVLSIGSDSANGGGLYNNLHGTVTCTDSVFWKNTVQGYGGAIYNHGAVSFSNSHVTGNSDRIGGGLWQGPSATVSPSNLSSTVYNNFSPSQDLDIDSAISIKTATGMTITSPWDFGVLAVSSVAHSVRLYLTNESGQSVSFGTPSVFGLNSSYFTTNITSSLTLAPGETREIILTITPGIASYTTAQFILATSNSKYIVLGGTAILATNAANLSVNTLLLSESQGKGEASYTIQFGSTVTYTTTVFVRAGEGLLIKTANGTWVRELTLTFTAGFTPQTITVTRDHVALAANDISKAFISHTIFSAGGSSDTVHTKIVSDVAVTIAPYIVAGRGSEVPITPPSGYDLVWQTDVPNIQVEKTSFSATSQVINLYLEVKSALHQTFSYWVISWGDGSRQYVSTKGTWQNLIHRYETAGTYNITVTLGNSPEDILFTYNRLVTHTVSATGIILPETLESALPAPSSPLLGNSSNINGEIFALERESELEDEYLDILSQNTHQYQTSSIIDIAQSPHFYFEFLENDSSWTKKKRKQSILTIAPKFP